jgi:hypothetical protein
MARKRSIRAQVISGLRIGGLIVLTFAIFAGMVLSASLIVDRHDNATLKQHVLGVLLLGSLTVVLFATVRHWTQWLIGALGYCTLRFLVGIFLVP